ncbi:MAG TPA: TonB-dependent receptor [Steroidobacteraceae bacterium]|nr:TonB-dependent receptor [Steroidobacteraceae bacterium]
MRRVLLPTVGAAIFGILASGTRAQTAPPAPAANTQSDQDLAEVIVTGTRIRGIAPVGSSVVQLDAVQLQDQGLTSVADTLNTVPFVLKLGAGNDYTGGASGGVSSLNGLDFNKGPDLRGFGSQATLSLVNGHRVAYEGANMNTFDGDNMPYQVLQRVEIVADGTSPIYGADAVAGTVNYVFRQPFTGVETYAQYGRANGTDNTQETVVAGYKWASGGFVLSYQHENADALQATSRPGLYNDNLMPFGGPGPSTFSSPGNIIVGGVPYAIPRGQNGSSLTLAQLGPAGVANTLNVWTGYDAIPDAEVNDGTLNFKQSITDWLEVFGDGFWHERDFNMALISTGNDATVTVPNSNFYSPCNRSLTGAPAALVAACGTGSLTVQYNLAYDPGAGPAMRDGYSKSWDAAVGLKFTLPGDWNVTLEASKGNHNELSNNGYFFGNGLGASPALAGTTAATAYNVFCDGQAFVCNSRALTTGLTGPDWRIGTSYGLQDYTVNADGSLFSLPGGKVRVAVGAEHENGYFNNVSNFGATPSDRGTNSGYLELYIPLVGDGNAFPGVKKLELDLAGRVDSYSDVGSTENPKIGLNWTPIDGLKVHGSFGTSFRAPGLADDNPYAQQGFLGYGVANTSVNATLCPTCASSSNLAVYDALGGANHDLKPEKSRTYSFGVDWAPPFIQGLTLSGNYWSVVYSNQVNYPVYNAGPTAAINQQVYNPYIIYNPTYFPQLAANNPVAFFGNFPTINKGNANCAAAYGQKVTTQALFNDLIGCINSGGDGFEFGAPPSPAGNILAVEDAHRINAGITKADGIDMSGLYSWDTMFGTLRVGANAELNLKWDVAPIAGAPSTNVNNSFLYPQKFRGRAEFGWSRHVDQAGLLGAHLYVNYDNAYHIDSSFLPTGVSNSYTGISSYTTVDMTLTYDSGDDLQWKAARNLMVIFSVQNLLNQSPPLVINSSSQGTILFDPLNTSPLLRMIQIQLGKKW